MKKIIYFLVTGLLVATFCNNTVLAQCDKDSKEISEMKALMRKYVHHDSLWHFDLTKEAALKEEVSSEVYDKFVSDMDRANSAIKELLAQGKPVRFADEIEQLVYHGPDSISVVKKEKI